MPLRAIIFDCDGVLVDSEPLHLQAFREVLKKEGIEVSREDYLEKYLALDDRDCFQAVFKEQGRGLAPERLASLMKEKAQVYARLTHEGGLLVFPGVPEFVMAVSQSYPLAIASGALKDEVEQALQTAGIRPYFEAIVTAGDVANGKPHPDPYLKALELLNASGKRPTPILPQECVVIEDARNGVTAAHAAGMKCAAIPSSHPAYELAAADLVVSEIAALKLVQLEDLFVPSVPSAVHPETHENH
jgi:beta-phosphoglucomutase-like phosphatase (HAD superfamily)